MAVSKTMRRVCFPSDAVDALPRGADRDIGVTSSAAEPRDFDRHEPLPYAVLESRGARATSDTAPTRQEVVRRANEDDGLGVLEMVPAPRPEVVYERPRSIITRNESSDVSFERAINPYRSHENGCADGVIRQTHAVAGTMLGFDAGGRLFAKAGAAEILEKELTAPRYQVKTIAVGTDVDPYNPVERTERVTRSVLEVLARTNHPVGIITKSALVLRDLDLLAPMARKGLVKVAISITTLDPQLARRLEPRASAPDRRLHAIEELGNAGVPVTAMVAPIIPAINDAEIETILTRAHARGAREAGYVMLRLPPEHQDRFETWLLAHYPDKHRHVMTLVRSMSRSKVVRSSDALGAERSQATGPFAWLIGRRFQTAMAKNGYAAERMKVRTDLFTRPAAKGEQLSLLW